MLLTHSELFNSHLYMLKNSLDDRAIYEAIDFQGLNLFSMVKYKIVKDEDGFDKSISGVCDNIDQILKTHHDIIIDTNKKYAIVTHKIYQHDQPSKMGWRWKKFGPYIGEHDIGTEYLYNEDLSDINQDYIIIFRILEVIKK